MKRFTALLSETSGNELSLAGGKATRLGELVGKGLYIPDGFVVLTEAYREFVKRNRIWSEIEKIMNHISAKDMKLLQDASVRISELFTHEEMSSDVASEIASRYQDLGEPAVAVRSSATAEDLPGASFAGQYDTFLNVRSVEAVLTSVMSCWASLWNAGAISYRLANRIPQDEETLSMACVVEELVDADKSGVLFTVNPLNNSKDQIVINSCFGLGEGVVSGEFACDHIVVDKNAAMTIKEEIGNKEYKIIPDEKNGHGTIEVPLGAEERERSSLSPEELVYSK